MTEETLVSHTVPQVGHLTGPSDVYEYGPMQSVQTHTWEQSSKRTDALVVRHMTQFLSCNFSIKGVNKGGNCSLLIYAPSGGCSFILQALVCLRNNTLFSNSRHFFLPVRPYVRFCLHILAAFCSGVNRAARSFLFIRSIFKSKWSNFSGVFTDGVAFLWLRF